MIQAKFNRIKRINVQDYFPHLQQILCKSKTKNNQIILKMFNSKYGNVLSWMMILRRIRKQFIMVNSKMEKKIGFGKLCIRINRLEVDYILSLKDRNDKPLLMLYSIYIKLSDVKYSLGQQTTNSKKIINYNEIFSFG
ncbi:unnamed protein product [Paramecium pentaurelia]|uniref:Uncharacterized protein n=1 Tax=Paramecium pentaurelia TaxID=43138 RepID=A0A8S1W2Z9_9CILI|nr:unnamed protein product [Paramecium pentaurelia]